MELIPTFKEKAKYKIEDKIGMMNFHRKITRFRPKKIELYDYNKKSNRYWFPITARTKDKTRRFVNHKKFNYSKVLYPHQQKAFDRIIAEANKNFCCIGALGTGYGKSIILSYLIEYYKTASIVILPNNELLKQIKETLEGFGLKVSVYGGGKKEIGDVTVMSARGLSLMTDEELHALNFDLVICDETHNMMAKGVRKALVHLNPSVQIGLSGTPWTNAFGPEEMKLFFGNSIEYLETPLQPEFIVCNYQNKTYENGPGNYTDFREELDDDEDRLKSQMDVINRMTKVYDTVLVLYDRIDKHVIQQYNAFNGNKSMLHGQMNYKERDENVNHLKKNGGVMFASAAIAKEGFDVPRIEAVCNFYPNKFDKNTIQATGRALRKHGNKTKGIVVDWVDNALAYQFKTRLKTYGEKFPKSKIIYL